MANQEKKIELGKIDPEHRQKLLKGKTFKFSEEEKAEKIKRGMNKEDIEEQQEEVKIRQELGREEKTATEDEIKPEAEQEKVSNKISFKEAKARQDKEFHQKTGEIEARKKLEAAYEEEERKAA